MVGEGEDELDPRGAGHTITELGDEVLPSEWLRSRFRSSAFWAICIISGKLDRQNNE